MSSIASEFSTCQRCRGISRSISISSQKGNTEMNQCGSTEMDCQHNQSDVYYIRPNSFIRNMNALPINDSPYNCQDDSTLLLNEHSVQHLDSPDSHCHVQQPEISATFIKARQQLIISSILCLFFMIAEVIGGYLANSLALMTDAAHMLSDFASFLISLFAIYMGQKKPTRNMSFGYYRAEVLGAVISVLIIWLISGVIVYMAIERIIKKEFNINADIMLIVSGSGVAMNILMGIVLHGMCNCHTHSHGFGSHGHSHGGDSHNHDHNKPTESRNINVRAALIHVIGDLIQSVGVLIAAYIIKYKPEYKLADPICTFIFSALVLFTTITIMKDALHVLMEGFPKGIDYFAILSDLSDLDGVKAVHSLHVWSLTMDKNALSVHLAIEPNQDMQAILNTALTLVRNKYEIFHPTIQVEFFDQDMISCKMCQGPQK